MKRVILITLAILLFVVPMAFAAIYTFTPPASIPDFNDFYHLYHYTWGINWTVPSNERIIAASLSISSLNNTEEPEENDALYVHLLNDPRRNVVKYNDYEETTDVFLGQGVLLTTFADNNWYYDSHGRVINPGEDFVYDFDSTELSALADYSHHRNSINNGTFGFGFDPDCYFRNDGVSFRIETTPPVPEPSSIMLLGMGILGLLGFRRKS